MSRVKYPPRSTPNGDTRNTSAAAVKTGCDKQRVAPATPNGVCEPERRPQSTAALPARVSARTVDGESARRLSERDPILTSDTVARALDKVRPAGMTEHEGRNHAKMPALRSCSTLSLV